VRNVTKEEDLIAVITKSFEDTPTPNAEAVLEAFIYNVKNRDD